MGPVCSIKIIQTNVLICRFIHVSAVSLSLYVLAFFRGIIGSKINIRFILASKDCIQPEANCINSI